MTMKICYHECAIYNAVMSSNTVSLTTARFVHKHIVGSLQNVHLPCTTYQISYNLLKIFIQLVADCGRKVIKKKENLCITGPKTFYLLGKICNLVFAFRELYQREHRNQLDISCNLSQRGREHLNKNHLWEK